MNDNLDEQNNTSLNAESNEGSYSTGGTSEEPMADDEGYMPQEYNPNTSYGSFKARQEQLNRESDEIKKRQQQREQRRAKRNQPNAKKEDSSSETADDGSQTDEKKQGGLKSKIGEKTDNIGEKVDNVRSKANQVKQKVNNVTHPVSALKDKAKDKVKEKVKKKVLTSLMKYWWAVAIAAAVFLVLLLVFLILLGVAGDDEEDEFMVDPRYDTSLTMVSVTNNYQNIDEMVEFERMTLKEYALGAAYAEFYGKLIDKTDEQIMEVYKAYFIIIKSRLLSYGKYDYQTKEISIKNSSANIPSCDIYNGCDIKRDRRSYLYVSSMYSSVVPGEVYKKIEPADSNQRNLLSTAYNDVMYLFLVPKDFDDVITVYDMDMPPYDDTIRDQIASIKGDYKKIINNVEVNDEKIYKKNFKIYNLLDYIPSFSYSEGTSYWWPIGSSKPTSGNIYGGPPTATYISSKFGPRTIKGIASYHHGIDIADANCQQNVIIASKGGYVSARGDGCPSVGSYGDKCNGGYGNYVIIDHQDGTSTVYAHMYKDSVSVDLGQAVSQGQILGLMGSSGSSTGCHLHFAIEINNTYTDPLDYVSPDNPRASSGIDNVSYQEGSNAKQSVCLTLKNSGFSNNAVAAIMTNIQAESSFNPTALGDNGTSYGLCQWHNGRYDALKNACGSNYHSVSCQLEYLIYELQNSYKSVYNMLIDNGSAYELASYYCINFEVPSNRYENCPKRAEKYADMMLEYVNNDCN